MIRATPNWSKKEYKKLIPAIDDAASSVEDAIKKWARIAAEAVSREPHINWRYVLAKLREWANEEGRECPYSVTYLVQLADTFQACEGDFDRGVPISVLIEGRNLENLLYIVQPGMTVGKMKAIVFKETNEDDRTVEEIEAEQKRHRLDGRTRAKKDEENAELLQVSADPEDVKTLLQDIRERVTTYKDALLGLQTEHVEFPEREVVRALDAAESLARVLKDLR